ncbi:butyrate kinase [Clostridium thermarum]|uniref:butyrate kinase n=1 Tax=Clostridium thermarum TaxID=1716543 RepID=UPI0011206EC6|nr:butyrate kinase [Clostridium thermarum]
MAYKVLVINPGSTSTKIAVFEDETLIMEETLRHSSEEIGKYKSIYEQFQFRRDVITKALKEKNFEISTLSAVVARGGMLKPIAGGTYEINETMLEDLKIGVQGQHASNLGGIIANDIAKELKIPAYIVDPVVVDEMDDVARITGLPGIYRKSIFHALNQKAVAKRYAAENGKSYEKINVIVAHMGGGVSVGAHQQGRVVDVNNAVDGEGPFSPERAGFIPMGDLVEMCFSGKYTYEEIKKLINGKGGFTAHLNTNDAREVIKLANEGNEKAKLVLDAMIYQVSKEIGKCAAVLFGKVDAIILTGGIAYNEVITNAIKERISFIADVVVYPGEDELKALLKGALRCLRGEELPKEYK